MRTRPAHGFTLMELLVVVGIIAVLMAMLVPALSTARASANRTACAANLHGIGKAMQMYAAQFNIYPTNPPPKVASKIGRWNFPPQAASVDDGGDPLFELYNHLKASGDPMANQWILVIMNMVDPKQFVCRADPNSPTPASKRYALDSGANGTFLNFGGAPDGNIGFDTFSYAFAYPWNSLLPTVGPWWKGNVDASAPIGADIGPSKASALDDPTSPSEKVSNSKNHDGKGQNVVFADAHVEFATRNNVGKGRDNIYTGAKDAIWVMAGGARLNVLTNLNADPNDVILVPARP